MSQTEIHREVEIELNVDEFAESPREWDNLGVVAIFHRNYAFGDKHEWESADFQGLLEGSEYLVLPVYMLDHSGITVSTSPFACPWDSGQVGFIACPKGKEDLTDEKILEVLEGEIKTLDMYVRGDVWAYNIESINDSCCGFYGFDDCLTAAKEQIDYHLDHAPNVQMVLEKILTP